MSLNINLQVIPKKKIFVSLNKRCNNKKQIKKYFGRKKIYVENQAGAAEALRRCKFFTEFHFDETRISPQNFKSLGGLIVLGGHLLLKSSVQFIFGTRLLHRRNIHHIQWKRAFGYAKNITCHHLPRKYMSCLKALSFKVSHQKSFEILGKVLPNLRLLKLVTLKYEATAGSNRNSVGCSRCAVFTRINNLPRVEEFNFTTSITELRNKVVQQNLQEFYSQVKIPKVSTNITRSENFSTEALEYIACILKRSDYISINLTYQSREACCNKDSEQESQNEMRKLALQSKRAVYFDNSFWPQNSLSINSILSYCESLKFLYLKMSGTIWKEDNFLKKDTNKWCKTLQTVVLDCGFFNVNSLLDMNIPVENQQEVRVYDLATHQSHKMVMKQSKVVFASPFLTFMRQLRKNALALQKMSMFLCIANLDAKCYNFNQEIAKCFEVEKKLMMKDFLEEISLINRLKKLELCSAGDLEVFPLNRILYLKTLDALSLGFCQRNLNSFEKGVIKNQENVWDEHLEILEAQSEICNVKEIYLKTSPLLKIQPFGVNFVSVSQWFKKIEVVEILDENKINMTFDMLYGLIMNILQSERIRRVVISTNLTNGFYSKNSQFLFPKQVNNYLEIIEKELFGQLEARIRDLMNLKLEEIVIGKLMGFKADYIFYNKS